MCQTNTVMGLGGDADTLLEPGELLRISIDLGAAGTTVSPNQAFTWRCSRRRAAQLCAYSESDSLPSYTAIASSTLRAPYVIALIAFVIRTASASGFWWMFRPVALPCAPEMKI